MNLSVIYKDKDRLLSYMSEQHYSKPYIVRHAQMSDFIFSHMKEFSWVSFCDITAWFEQKQYTASYLKDVKKVLRNLEFFHEKGYFPGNGAIKRALKENQPSCGTLNLAYLQKHMGELLTYMKSHDYCDGHIRTVRFIGNRIIVLSREISWNSYAEIWDWYQGQNLRKSYLQNVLAVLGIFEAFHIRGQMPNNRETSNALHERKNAYAELNPTFRKLVDYSCSMQIQRNLAKSTVYGNKSVSSSFLFAMQNAGADTLRKIEFSLINNFFHSNAIRVNGKGLSPKIKRFLNDCIPVDKECRRIRFLIPAAPVGRKNIQYITNEESKAFCHALSDKNNKLTYKARAIGTILYYTGLRSVDIANLKLDSINLQKQLITLVQSKTRTPLTLPLLPVVGNAIYDYCIGERPPTNSQYLFVGNSASHHRVGTGAITIAVNTVMAVAEIRLEKKDRKGTHIFRHRAATTMMENNISPAVVSRTLGHSSPNSLDPYLYADKVHLKECALSLASFPLAKEVFEHVQFQK